MNACAARPVTTLLVRLEGVREVAPGRWRARCPAHDGHRPALAITECDDRRVLLHCFAGCGVDAVAAALGLDLADLFPPREPDGYDVHLARPATCHGRRFTDAQWLPALTLELLEVMVVVGAILRRGSVTASEHARLVRSVARILDAEARCHG
ncbi:DNA primase [Paraburkholderia adhaesiva]|uniref:DNA primase n=1 Tax=Paraburkholderia adhaesiva TaxID=2883244 RepID=UPI001F37B0E3|nr:DNA primase [Paraburkholderia adhaesiva]